MAWAAEVLNLRRSPPINDDGDAEDGAGGGLTPVLAKILKRCEHCFGFCDVIDKCNHN